MARRLIDSGHQVTMVCGSYAVGKTGLDGPFENGKRRGEIDGIDLIEIDLSYSNADGFFKRSLTFLKYSVSCVAIALRHEYDLVFATTTPLTVGIPGIFAKIFRRKPFIFEVRDLWPELPKAMGVITNPLVLMGMSCLEFASYRLADGCIGLSPGIVKGIEKRGVSSDKIKMIPNGCDISLFDGGNRDAWSHEGISRDDFVAVFAGSHGVANGLDAVLAAARVLKNRDNRKVKIVLVGDGKLKSALKEEALESALDNVLFLDPVPKTELSNLMKRADIGLQILANISAFYYGTSPNKFFDYLSSGLPVLVNYPGWVAGMVDEWNCGLSVEPDNPEAFADALEKAAAAGSEREEWGRRAKDLALEKFDREILSREWVEFVESFHVA